MAVILGIIFICLLHWSEPLAQYRESVWHPSHLYRFTNPPVVTRPVPLVYGTQSRSAIIQSPSQRSSLQTKTVFFPQVTTTPAYWHRTTNSWKIVSSPSKKPSFKPSPQIFPNPLRISSNPSISSSGSSNIISNSPLIVSNSNILLNLWNILLNTTILPVGYSNVLSKSSIIYSDSSLIPFNSSFISSNSPMVSSNSSLITSNSSLMSSNSSLLSSNSSLLSSNSSLIPSDSSLIPSDLPLIPSGSSLIPFNSSLNVLFNSSNVLPVSSTSESIISNSSTVISNSSASLPSSPRLKFCNPMAPPSCVDEKFGFCIDDDEYPLEDIEAATEFSNLTAQFSYKLTVAEEKPSLVVDNNSDDLIVENACQSLTVTMRPLRARNLEGDWRVIVQDVKDIIQRQQMTICSSPDIGCRNPDHFSRVFCFNGKCNQKFVVQKFLAFDPCNPERDVFVDSFKIQSECNCRILRSPCPMYRYDV